VAKIEAENNSKMRAAEMQKEVEFRRIAMETEKLRAMEMSKAQVFAEKEAKDAEGVGNATRIKAEAVLFSKQKEADGILAVYNAQAQGVQQLVQAFAGNSQALMQYLMLDRGIYETLSNTNAKAIQGLNPKITIWNTSGDAQGNSSYTKSISDVMKAIPPLMTTIHDQTGIQPPSWLGQLPTGAPPAEIPKSVQSSQTKTASVKN